MINQEQQRIYFEKKLDKKTTYNTNSALFLILLFLCFTSLTYASHPIQHYPNKWKCSQCGYENYEGIRYCAVCGKKK